MKQNDKFFRNLFVVIVVFLTFAVIYQVSSLLPPVLCGLLLAYILFPLVRKLTSYGMPKGVSIFSIFMTMFVVIIYSGYILMPLIQKEVVAISAKQDEDIKQSHIYNIINKISEQLYKYHIIQKNLDAQEVITDLRNSISQESNIILGQAGGAAKETAQFLMIFLFVFVFALLDAEKIPQTLISFIPNSLFEPGLLMLRRTTDLFGDYLRGLVIENFILGIIAFVMLVILSLFVPLSITMCFLISLIIALTNVIRIVGPFIGAAIGVVFVLASEPDLLSIFGVLTIAFIVQIIDNVLLLPLIMREQVDVHPVISLLSISAGGMIAGILGMIIAIPIAGAIKVLFQTTTIEMKKFRLE